MAHYLAIKKLTKGPGHLRSAARHNLRELQAELGAGSHINAARMADNIVLAGPATADDVAALADRLMLDAGATVRRKDAVRAVEIVFSLPPATSIDANDFFQSAVEWAREFFAVPLLSAVIHNDESAPHCHVLLLPLVNGRMAGSDLIGNRARLQAVQTGFFESVGSRYGLARPKAAKRLNVALRRKAAELAYTAVVSDSDLLVRPLVEQAILEAFGRNPEPLLEALNISMPTQEKSYRKFVAIMTKPCKPEPRQRKPIEFDAESKPIGFEERHMEISKPYVSVGFPQSDAVAKDAWPMPNTIPAPPPLDMPLPEPEYTRCQDDLPAELWDAELGEFRNPVAGQGEWPAA